MTQSEYFRGKKFDDAMFRFEEDLYKFSCERNILELKRLGRGHHQMDGGALWTGRALIEEDQIWLALWGNCKDRFEVVLE